MYVATIQHFNNSRQESKHESKKNNLQFMFLTHLSQYYQTYENLDPKQVL